MYLEIHFLNSHLDFFPENLGTISDKNEEQFHQDISNMKSGTKASADQVWTLKTDAPQTKYSKKSTIHLLGKQRCHAVVQKFICLLKYNCMSLESPVW